MRASTGRHSSKRWSAMVSVGPASSESVSPCNPRRRGSAFCASGEFQRPAPWGSKTRSGVPPQGPVSRIVTSAACLWHQVVFQAALIPSTTMIIWCPVFLSCPASAPADRRGSGRARLPIQRCRARPFRRQCPRRDALSARKSTSDCPRSRSALSLAAKVPEKTPRTVCRCQPVALATSSTVAPSGRCSIAMTASCFDGRFASDWASGSGNASMAKHS
jgi:hypothetical protein